ncbi:MAG: ABC transporter substrate-binding protein, partial [Methanospirillum sp.]|nr:ABC transporter substrate-binding protein [Methanospirillum sp.]
GTEPAAEKYLNFLDKWKKSVTNRVLGISPEQVPTVYAEGYSDYAGQGKNSGTDLLITLAKGKNLAGDLGEQWPKVTPEWIVSEDPHVIMKVVTVKPEKTLDQVRSDLFSRTGFETLSAIKNNRVYVMNGDLAFGPRSPVGLVYIARMLHPEKFSDISPSDVLKEYADTFVSGMETGEYFSPVL